MRLVTQCLTQIDVERNSRKNVKNDSLGSSYVNTYLLSNLYVYDVEGKLNYPYHKRKPHDRQLQCCKNVTQNLGLKLSLDLSFR